jgi:fibro-slime domain-containing protein
VRCASTPFVLSGLLAVAMHILVPMASAQVAAPAKQPGLAPVYFYGIAYDDISEFYDRPRAEGKPGPPLLVVDYRSGSGQVLTSDDSNLVGAHIEGLIHLDAAGTYEFAFESNDGVRLEIDGKLVVEDTGVHSDQFSDVREMSISQPGWYPLTIWYFEKRNTSTLRLFWRKPGEDPYARMQIVPAAALAHVPGG